MTTGYACKECGAEAAVDLAGIVRTCGHLGTVIASMRGTAYGEGASRIKLSALEVRRKLADWLGKLFTWAVKRRAVRDKAEE